MASNHLLVSIRVYDEDAKLLKILAASGDMTIPEVLHAILVAKSSEMGDKVAAYRKLLNGR